MFVNNQNIHLVRAYLQQSHLSCHHNKCNSHNIPLENRQHLGGNHQNQSGDVEKGEGGPQNRQVKRQEIEEKEDSSGKKISTEELLSTRIKEIFDLNVGDYELILGEHSQNIEMMRCIEQKFDKYYFKDFCSFRNDQPKIVKNLFFQINAFVEPKHKTCLSIHVLERARACFI